MYDFMAGSMVDRTRGAPDLGTPVRPDQRKRYGYRIERQTTTVNDMSQPAVALIAVPGRRTRTVELAVEIERRGFTGIWCPSMGDCMALCQDIAHGTSTITMATSIQPIYLRHALDLGGHAAYLHEISEGRFRLGLGVTHQMVHNRLGVTVGKPLEDMRDYVAGLRRAEKTAGPLPPIVLATLRDRMLDLSLEISEGAVWANAAFSDMARAVARIPTPRRDGGFVVANMIPTVIDNDIAAAMAVNRRTMITYVQAPNYRNYWKLAGYVEEMEAIEAALAAGNREGLTDLMSDVWLNDATLAGPADAVRERLDAWADLGVTPIVVPSAVSGGQMAAMDALFATYA